MSSNRDSENDPLEGLLVDREAIDRERLAEVLDGLVAIDREDGDLLIQTGFHNLNSRAQMVALLLAKRAASTLDVIDEEELSMTSTDVEEYVDVSRTTIDAYGNEKLSFVTKDMNRGGYYVPVAALTKAIEYLQNARNTADA